MEAGVLLVAVRELAQEPAEEKAMTIPLSEPLQQALDACGSEPLRVVDPRTQRTYVLLQAEMYERVQALLEEAEDQALQEAWLEMATKARRAWVQENPY